METMAPIADLELMDADRQTQRLGDSWQDKPVIVVWLRHFG
jgi:hypothetical protein